MWGTPPKAALQSRFPTEDLARILRITFPSPVQTTKASGISDDAWTGHRIVVRSERAPLLVISKRAVVVRAEQTLWYAFFWCSLNNSCQQPFFFSKC